METLSRGALRLKWYCHGGGGGAGDILHLELIEHTKLSHLIDRRHPVTIIHWNGVITVANAPR